MRLFAMMDALLRDRDSLYEQALSGEDTRRLTLRLLAVFALTGALYGGAMGAYRWIHPEYVFGDFEITAPGADPVRAKVTGMIPGEPTVVYTKEAGLPVGPGATVRFNITDPTDAYAVAGVSTEKGYTTITLEQGAQVSDPNAWLVPILVSVKTPLLFLLTLAICAPALYVLNLMSGMGLRFGPVMTLMAFALAATGVVLGVFIPIVTMFAIVTHNYHFMKVMHLVIFSVAGVFGVKVLGEGLFRMAPVVETDVGPQTKPWVRVRSLLISWLLLYALVGGQLAWTLKPFLGTPYLPETPPFRIESGNIYVSVFGSMGKMMK